MSEATPKYWPKREVDSPSYFSGFDCIGRPCAMPIRCPGSRLKRIRKEVLTQQQAAKLVGVTRLTIRRWMGFFETTPVRQRGWCAPRMVLTRDLIEFMDRTKRVDWDI